MNDPPLAPANPLELGGEEGYPPPGAVSLGTAGLRPWVRGGLLLVGLGLSALLTTAACLTPSSSGIGTHQQLGLPPCSMVQLVGLRCPACGMTTSWAHLLKGRVAASFQANAGGALLGLVSLCLAPWSIATAWQGRWFLLVPRDELVLAVTLTIAGVTAVDWMVRVCG